MEAAQPPRGQRRVDIHTHIYPPAYISLLSSRTSVPYLHQPASSTSGSREAPRLIILPSDDAPGLPRSQRGRPLGASYSSLDAKLAFMRQHAISCSIVSLANPWLDWVEPDEAAGVAASVNDDLAALCEAAAAAPQKAEDASGGGSGSGSRTKLYAFGTLPLSAPSSEAIVAEIGRIAKIPAMRGVIMGTSGRGAGLDDDSADGLEPVWAALERSGLLLFLHPHYGLPETVFGPRAARSGHVLPLALGFPLETTIAFTRMYLAGVFDRHPRLRILLAHAGGAVPFLAGRLESCVAHERTFWRGDDGNSSSGSSGGVGANKAPSRSLREVLRSNVWLDGVVYGKEALRAAADLVGPDRVLWGTDHPFFPPLEGGKEGEGEEEEGNAQSASGKEWLSVTTNVEAAVGAFPDDPDVVDGILGGNAIKLLDLDVT